MSIARQDALGRDEQVRPANAAVSDGRWTLERISKAVQHRLRKLRAMPLHARLRDQVRELETRKLSIVSSNCVAGLLYEIAGLRKESPTVGLYFSDGAFPQFLADFALGRMESWTELSSTQLAYNEDKACWEYLVPQKGSLIFLHYETPAAAVAKWNSRLRRLIGREPVVIASPREGLASSMLEQCSASYRYLFVLPDDDAPAADDLVLDRRWLKALSAWFDWVLTDFASSSQNR